MQIPTRPQTQFALISLFLILIVSLVWAAPPAPTKAPTRRLPGRILPFGSTFLRHETGALPGFQVVGPSSGEKIVYSSIPADNFEIFVMNPDGSNQINLTNNVA